MTVPVRGTIRPVNRTVTFKDGDGKMVTLTLSELSERTASEIGERLVALEKDTRGAGEAGILSPGAVPFGPGADTNVTNVTNIVEGTTDHGALTGLLDDDHPQYVQHGEKVHPKPHQHQTGPAVDLTYEPSGPGTSTLVAAADHTHRMALGIESIRDDLGVANDLSLDGMLDANITQLVAAWKMEEASGTRANEIDSTAITFTPGGSFRASFFGPVGGRIADLYECLGTTSGEAGYIGNAFRPVIDPGDLDYREHGLWLRSPAYVGWYPLGQGNYPFDTATEGANGNDVSGTIAILFKPETGIITTGLQTIGGLASFNSFPYGVLGMGTRTSGGVLQFIGGTTNQAGTGYYTTDQVCSLDTWHIGFVWFDHRTKTLGAQLDNNPPQTTTMTVGKVWYGNFTYWMTGPRFKGLVDTSLLFKGVLSAEQRQWLIDTMLTGAADIDFEYEAKRIRATLSINPQYRTRPRPHQHSRFDVPDLRPDDAQWVIASRMFGR